MRRNNIAVGEYYHIFNRGINKDDIFIDENDWARFLFLILYHQSPFSFFNLNRYTSNFVRHRMFNIDTRDVEEISKNRQVKLTCFSLMPNHFHLILQETKEGGISKQMQRIQNAYTKYFNTKYKRSGHLFQGPYKAVHIEDNNQLLYLSAYIHRNPRELKDWKGKEDKFIWSSYMDFVKINRWGKLLEMDIILEQFSNLDEYRKFVEMSNAKLLNK